MKKVILIMVSAMAIAACSRKPAGEPVPALDLSNLDTTVSPSADFYKYATGGWQQNNPLKPEFARFGSFDQLREDNVKRLNDLFASMTTMKTSKGSVEQKIADLYKQGLDSVKLNEDGAAPIKKYVDEIYAVADKEGLVKKIAELHNEGVGPFFGAYVASDLADSDNQILYFGQGGLGIGDRDYYVEKENAGIKEDYGKFLEKIFTLAGVDDPQRASANALAVEDALALNSWTSVQERDIEAQYNVYSSGQLEEKFPGFGWQAYLDARGIPAQEKLVVAETDFFEKFGTLFADTDLQVLKDYVAGQFIEDGCNALSDDFYKASFDFFSTRMSGVTEQKMNE